MIINYYKNLRINVIIDEGLYTILLKNITYIPKYLINLMSLHKALFKGVD